MGRWNIQDDIGIAESERELPELIDQDSGGNIRVSSSIIPEVPLFLQRHLFPFESLSIKEEPCGDAGSTADTWNRVAVSLVSFNSTSKGRLILSLLVIPSFNRS